MAKCSECGKELVAFSEYECSYCGNSFCSEHRLPESHHCEMNAKKKVTKVKRRRREQKSNGFRKILRKILPFI